MNRKRILQLQDFNPHLICSLCNGYFIDATTIIECLHSFCRACIVRYLETNRFCPVCDVQIHKSKPLLNIRKDATLQALVYKLVPGLYQNEMRLRQEFAEKHPEATPSKMEDSSNMCIYAADEYFSLTLEHWNPIKDVRSNANESTDESLDWKDAARKESPSASPNGNGKRYLRCPAAVTVGHIHKLIRAKHGLDPSHLIELLFKDDLLPDYLTLVDVAYIYKWKRKGPLSLSYRMYANSFKRIKLDPSSTCAEAQSSAPESRAAEGKDAAVKPLHDETEPTDKNTNWQEVQLQISETGIMSVSGISLEHNNNLSTPNNNIFDNQTECKSKNPGKKLETVSGLPKYLTLVDSYCDDLGAQHDERALPEPKLSPCTGANTQEAALPGIGCEPASDIAGNKLVPMSSKQPESVNAESKEKKSCPVRKNSKVNVHSFSEPADETRIANVCTPLQQPDLQNAKRQKLSDVPKLPKEIIKPASDSHIPRDSSKSNQMHLTNLGTKKEPAYHQPIGSSSNTAQMYHQNLTAKKSDTKNLYSPSSSVVPAITMPASKKDASQANMSYNTRKDSPKNWNPSFTKASYPILKNKPPTSGSNVNNNLEVKVEKAPKFFKMRNMPRYLGNPASGVKPMYQLSDNSKTPQAEPATRTKNVVMKIDPKTLSPIVCVTTSESLPGASDGRTLSDYKSSQPSCSQKSATEGTNCLAAGTSSELDSLKKLSSEKSKSAGGNQVSSSSTLTTTTSTAVTNSKSSPTCASALSFKMNHARSISATTQSSLHHEFCNDVPPQRSIGVSSLEPNSTTAASSAIKFGNVPKFALNPATLNLLSSNLSFLPNASNFLYGNFADFGQPLVRAGLSRSGCLGVMASGSGGGANGPGGGNGGVPTGMGAYHSMPPSINMLFPHHRSTERERTGAGATHTQVQTPAVQRIPASKGTASAPTAAHKPSAAKKSAPGGNKTDQVHATSSTRNTRVDKGNESVSAVSTKSDVLGTLAQTQRTDKQATNLNNNSILSAENAEKIEDKKLSVNDESLMQKDVIIPNGELDSSICVTSSDTHHGSEIIARNELRVDEDVEKDGKGKQRPLTDLSIKIKTGDTNRNLNEEVNDNNNKKVKFPNICLESTGPLMAPDVITKPCTDPR